MNKRLKKTVKSIGRKDTRRREQLERHMVASGLTHDLVLDCLYSNEDGDAKIFQSLYRDRYIYDHGAALWAEWAVHYWEDDETENTYKAIEGVIDIYQIALEKEKALEKEAEAAEDKEEVEKHMKIQETLNGRIRTLQSAARKRNVLWLAGIGTGLTGREWDRDPWLFACENGVLDLRTGTLRPGQQNDYIKTATDILYDPQAESPTWDQFLDEIFENENLILYVQRLFGYGLTGLKQEHVLPILWGDGRNGKGTFLETLKLVMGDLAHKTRAEVLLDTGKQKSSGSADADVIAFRGKRLIWASETSEGERLNVGKIKELVGGDTLNARAPYGRRVVEFEPTHLLCMITNSRPYAPASDFALWERIHLIPFTLSFVDNPKKKNERAVNKKLPEQLKSELPGILAWLVKGCLYWQERGLDPPEMVKNATSKYQEENDLIGDFIAECCVLDENSATQAGPLYSEYKDWAEGLGHKPINGTRFGKEMKKRFDNEKRKNRVFYIGIGSIYEESDSITEDSF